MKLQLILLLSILCTFLSCTQTATSKEETSQAQPVENDQTKPVEKERKVIQESIKNINNSNLSVKKKRKASDDLKEDSYIAITKSWMKSTPTLLGESVGIIEYGESCTFLHEISDEQHTEEFRGERVTDYWKKVKKNIPDPTGQSPDTEIEGWVFGGQIMKASEIYRNTSPDHYERKIISTTNKKLSEILGFKVNLMGFYNGTVHYRINKENEWQKNGKFKIHCLNQAESADSMITQQHEYRGNFSSDVPHGLFEKISIGHMSNRHSKVFYDSGRCLWAEATETVDGIDHLYREELPKKCDFEYIDKEMFKKEFNMEF